MLNEKCIKYMRLLFELKIPDDKLEKSGYNVDDVAELTSSIVKQYWYDEGIVLKRNPQDVDDSVPQINIYI